MKALAKITILAFEGPDKVGKSSLIREVNEHSNYRYLCIDRFIASAWVYDKLTGRRNRAIQITNSVSELIKLKSTLFINVFLKCDPIILASRIHQLDEYGSLRLKNLDKMIALFDFYERKIDCLPKIVVDTSNVSISESAKDIIDQVENYEKHYC